MRPIKEYLFKQNLEVITWLDGDTAATLMDYHHKNLRECDAALVYFGNGDEPWVRKNLEDLEKAYGYGREQDWSAAAVYVGAPQSDQKEDFLTHLVPYVIRNYSRSILMTCRISSPPCTPRKEANNDFEQTVKNPFPGLRPFETDEYRLFFGREGQADELLSRL